MSFYNVFHHSKFHASISQGPIHWAVFRDCTPASLICLSMTCHHVRTLVFYWLKFAYNIDRFLMPYFDHPSDALHFRHLQATCSAIISGSSAIQFLDRTRYADTDLDVYVDASVVHVIGHWLMTCGYQFKPSSKQKPRFTEECHRVMTVDRLNRNRQPPFLDASQLAEPSHPNPYASLKIAAVFDMVKGGQEDRRIQLIGTHGSPVEAVLSFHSTCVMNFITFDAVYSLYPRSTYEDRTSLLTQSTSMDFTHLQARQKYLHRGWKMITGEPLSILSTLPRADALGGMERRVGDRYTWKMPLDTSWLGLSLSERGRFAFDFRASTWKLSILSDEGGSKGDEMTAEDENVDVKDGSDSEAIPEPLVTCSMLY